MWEYYTGIYEGLIVLFTLCSALSIFFIIIASQVDNRKVFVFSFFSLLLSIVFLIFLPNKDFAKRRACEIEKVEYICKEIKK
jgi:uncharacterized protein (DUF58 family)